MKWNEIIYNKIFLLVLSPKQILPSELQTFRIEAATQFQLETMGWIMGIKRF